MHIGICFASAVLAVASGAVGDSDKHLTASVATEHFDLKYRPGSRAGASVDVVAARAEEDFDRITRALELKVESRFDLYLYDDVGELQKITHTEGNAGFSAENAMHVPYDNDQTRLHEMVHVIALHLPVGCKTVAAASLRTRSRRRPGRSGRQHGRTNVLSGVHGPAHARRAASAATNAPPKGPSENKCQVSASHRRSWQGAPPTRIRWILGEGAT
ncbi:MAG: hypothetical protein GY711_25390 [bacterium]|nr:hypothetical protein [bacterium]